MENSKNKKIGNMGVNKMGRNVKKTHLHHLNYGSGRSQQPESTVHVVDKEDFKSFVQRFTGSPNHPPNRPLNNNPIPSITRLKKLRPPPLSLVRQAFPIPTSVSIAFAIPAPVLISTAPKAPTPSIIDFPGLLDRFKKPSPTPTPSQPSTIAPQPSTIAPTTIAPQPITVAASTIAPQHSTVAFSYDMSSDNMVESPISACVRQLLDNPDSNVDQFQLQPQPQPQPQEVPSNFHPQHPLIRPQHHSSNVIAPLVSENVTTTNPIVSVNASNNLQFEPNGTIINALMPVNVKVNAITNNSLMPVNVSNGSNQLEPNGIPSAPSSPTDFINIPFPSPPSPNEPLFPIDIDFSSPQSPCGPLFPTDIQLPSPPSPPLFPPDFEFPSPHSPYGPLLSPRSPPPFSPVFFPISPSGLFPMPPGMPGQT